jgi:hypothetical protein
MALKRLTTEETTSENLPWVADYVMDDPERIDTALWVEEVFQTPKGYLIITSEFKGFVFTNSSMYKFLAEALELWIGKLVDPTPLFAVAGKSGKVELAVDDEMPKSYWTKDGRRWIQKRGKDKASGLKQEIVNPLLSSPSRTSGTPKGKRTTATDEYATLTPTTH